MRKHLLSGILAGAALCCSVFTTQAENKQSDEEIFNIVSAKLDKGGSYYSIQNTKYLFAYIKNGLGVVRNVMASVPPKQLGGMPPLLVMDAVEAIINDSGIGEILACGMSSKLINPNDKEPLFQNKTFLYYGAKKPRGFLWTLVPPANKELTDLYRLPENTLSAFSADIEPAKIWEALKQVFAKLPLPQFKMLPMLAEMQFMQKNKIQLPVFLKSLSGSWFGLIVSTKAADGKPALQGMLEIPAGNAVFFDLIKNNLKTNPLALIANDKITFKAGKNQPKWIVPTIFVRDKKLYLISSPAILESTANALAKRNGLIATAEFKRMNQKMPKQGLAFVYKSPRIPTVVTDMINAYVPAKDAAKLGPFMPLLAGLANSAEFTVATRSEDGVLVYSNSPVTTVSSASLTPVATSAILAGMLLPALNNAREKARRISCTSNLKQLLLCIKQYSMDNKDMYPQGDNAAGLNKLIKGNYVTDLRVFICPSTNTPKGSGELKEANSSYIYLGGFKEFATSPDTPIIFDKPGNHNGYVNVAFSDGHVKGFPLKYTTCEGVIRAMCKYHNYKPELLAELLKKAQKIDKELGYK